VVINVFSVDIENTKVVANLLFYLVLKFYDPRSYGLGVISFRSLLSESAHVQNRSECLLYLTHVHKESCLGDNRRSVVLFLSFRKCPIALILVV
jgi:hypothetical protein